MGQVTLSKNSIAKRLIERLTKVEAKYAEERNIKDVAVNGERLYTMNLIS